MTPEQLDIIERRATAATEGPWEVRTASTGIRGSAPYAWIMPVTADIGAIAERHNAGTESDVEFLAHARTDVPALIAEVRRLRGAVDSLQDLHAKVSGGGWAICHACADPWPCKNRRHPGRHDKGADPMTTAREPYIGYEGAVGPFPRQYHRPHVYARDVYSGAGNCVCGRDPRNGIHPELAPGVPNPNVNKELLR